MNSKKTKLIAALLLLSALAIGLNPEANAQARAGIKGGLNVSNLYIDDVDDENARYGFNVGLYGQVLSSETFALQPELLFSTKGTKADYNGLGGLMDQTVKFNLNYLDLPVLAVFKLGDAAEIHVGPYASYLLNANISYSGNVNGDDELDKDQLKSYDFGLAGGLGMNFGPVQVGARYNYGLVKIADSNVARDILGDSRNSCAQLYVALNLTHEKEE